MEELRELLIRSFDEDLSGSDKQRLEDALKSSESLRAEKKEIENLRSILAKNESTFEEGFSDRVMNKVVQSKDNPFKINSSFYKMFQRIALSGVAAIILLLISIYFIDGTINLDSLYGLNNYSPEETELSLFTTEDFE